MGHSQQRKQGPQVWSEMWYVDHTERHFDIIVTISNKSRNIVLNELPVNKPWLDESWVRSDEKGMSNVYLQVRVVPRVYIFNITAIGSLKKLSYAGGLPRSPNNSNWLSFKFGPRLPLVSHWQIAHVIGWPTWSVVAILERWIVFRETPTGVEIHGRSTGRIINLGIYPLGM